MSNALLPSLPAGRILRAILLPEALQSEILFDQIAKVFQI
jgi:hypothetical protein